MSTLRTREKSFPNFCNVKIGNDFSLAASAQGRFDKGCNRNLFPAVKLAAEVFLFDGGALVVDLLAFG